MIQLRNMMGACAALVVMASSSQLAAATYSFTSILSGDQEVPPVSTTSSGSAALSVDSTTQTLSFNLNVVGISLDGLFDALVAAPVGPVHLHNAAAGSNGPIVVPFAFDPATYQDTSDGFSLAVTDFAYSDAVAISGSAVSFADFVAGLRAEDYYINVHSDAFNSGELRGQLAPIPVPAAGFLMLGSLAGFAALRRRKKPA